MIIKRLAVATLLLSAVAFSGCKPDDDGPTAKADLDSELLTILTTAGGTSGADYFKLPASDDFSKIPQDPKNTMTAAKVELGKFLFHETALAMNPKLPEGEGTYSCAACHHAEAGFQAGRPQGISDGGTGFANNGLDRVKREDYPDDSVDVQPIRTPTAMNIAYQENVLWDGAFGATGENASTDAYWTPGTPKETNNLGYTGVETQAIAGLMVHRLKIEGSLCESNVDYKQMFAAAFPDVAEDHRITREYAGLAIAAYERSLLPNEAPFQKWLAGDNTAMADNEKRGAIVFMEKGKCATCHTGPALNSMAFYGYGMNDLRVLNNVFQKGEEDHKGRGGFTGLATDDYTYKVPQLYNMKDSPFLGHGASFNSIREVVEYKNNGVAEHTGVPTSQLSTEFKPLGLTDDEVADLTAFMETALYDANLKRYLPEALPSGNCFPVNDAQSKIDLGCN